jgi:hypothetical protein
MAQVDTNIAMGFRPVQIESPVNQMAAISQLQNLQQQQQMNALKMQEYQRGTQQRNALARIHADPKVQVGSPEYLARVQAEAPDLFEEVLTRGQKRAELEEKIEANKFKNFTNTFSAFKTLVPSIRNEYDVVEYTTAAYNNPHLKPYLEDIQPLERAIEANTQEFYRDPENWRMQAMAANPKELFDMIKERREANKPISVAPGGQLVTPTGEVLFSADQKTPADPELVKEYKFATDPARGKDRFTGSLLDFKEAVAKAGRPISTTQTAPTITMVLDPNDNTRMLSIDAKTYRGGSLGSQGVIGIAGKEPTVGKKQEAKEAAQSNAETTIAQLRQSYDQLDRLGGITSTRNRVGTNIAAGLSSSAAGQFTGRLLGTEAQSERNKIAQTRPLLMTTIMQAMGLSAKQLDSNAELKLWLSAATDPTLDLEANRDALNNLERMLTGKGKGAGAGATPPAAPKPKSDVRSRADAILGQ